MVQTNNNVGHIIRHFLPKIIYKRGLSKHQLKVLNAIAKCRTKALGGSVLACKGCGEMHYVMHSCRNRNCPNCQGIDKELWIEDRKNELLPTRYYHVVFTVPCELRKLFAYNKEVMYNLLLTTAWEVLSTFGKNDKKLRAQMGAIAILHTWDQKMNYHPHVHFIVPGGGINKCDQWVAIKKTKGFLFDVIEMSKNFSAKCVNKIRKLKKKGEITGYVPKNMIEKQWVVFSKRAFGSPMTVVEYLGRYTHRVAISNGRILKVTETHVTFQWLDRNNNYTKKQETITGEEFVLKFAKHIVPKYFRKIRHFGFLSSRNKNEALNTIRDCLKISNILIIKPTRSEILKMRFGEQALLSCKSCGGELSLLKTYAKERAPPNFNNAVIK